MTDAEADIYLNEQVDILSMKVTKKHKPFDDDDQTRLIVDFVNCLRKTRELSKKVNTKFSVNMTSKIAVYLNK